jgi:SAM-dependent methyltransferase
MCEQPTAKNKILGQRLNKSQGITPKNKWGITTTVIRCSNCQLIYSNPKPIPFDVQDHYGVPPEDYWKESYFTPNPAYFAHELAIAKRLLPEQARPTALDIGAGLGKCMQALEHAGFEAYGLEPSVPFRQMAIQKMGIDARRLKLGMLEELDYPANQFNFITFGAVLEHLYQPAECIERALAWLKPNGLIQIEVPSSNHLVSKILNLYYRLNGTTYVTNLSPMHEPFHLYEFGLKSFEELAKRLPFEIAFYEYKVCTIYHLPKPLHPPLRWYMEKTNMGLQLAVWLRKKGE